jgi:hypothetical protein
MPCSGSNPHHLAVHVVLDPLSVARGVAQHSSQLLALVGLWESQSQRFVCISLHPLTSFCVHEALVHCMPQGTCCLHLFRASACTCACTLSVHTQCARNACAAAWLQRTSPTQTSCCSRAAVRSAMGFQTPSDAVERRSELSGARPIRFELPQLTSCHDCTSYRKAAVMAFYV